MTIEESVYTALHAVLPNTHAVELPKRPTWPAILFDIESTPEDGWGVAVTYEQHVIAVVTFGRSLAAIKAMRASITAAMEAIPGYMAAEDHGDADYEGDPEVYAYFQNYRIRTRTL
ncbi:hypothetical protein ACFQUU_27160 [Herbaspirillum sp. GCM10030257]|uniref:hypothetical protein n=1 Tax=Herbaspirillum sp. GCM10030257 TaxID=3273393 RepID=UPI003622D078